MNGIGMPLILFGRKGAWKAMRCREVLSSPLGALLLETSETAVTGLWFVGEPHCPALHPGHQKNSHVLHEAKRWLADYFHGKAPSTDALIFAPEGTEFAQDVWRIVRSIPYGRTRTYGDIAAQLAAQKGIGRMSAQAVGRAVARNPISILLPCHRVVGRNGSLTGYTGGLERKAMLLAHERGAEGPIWTKR